MSDQSGWPRLTETAQVRALLAVLTRISGRLAAVERKLKERG
jgi:hypothetical protein